MSSEKFPNEEISTGYSEAFCVNFNVVLCINKLRFIVFKIAYHFNLKVILMKMPIHNSRNNWNSVIIFKERKLS